MITEFQGEYRWLSNFAPVLVLFDGTVYPSVEHAYMSAKSGEREWKLFCENRANSAGDVKRASRSVPLVSDWDNIKRNVMLECLRSKFSQEPYRARLLATGMKHLQEGNRWGDCYWGVDLRKAPPRGLNVLGQLLMQVREELRSA